MKKILLVVLMFALTISLFSQEKKEVRIPTLGELAPSFTAESTQGEINFPEDYFNKWKVIFSHPSDFTPVCSTELIELANKQEEFENLDAKIFVISTDGLNSHLEWINSMESINYKDRKTPKINFPIISDVNMQVSRLYGMIHPYENSTHNVRGVFIISPDNHIRFFCFYPTNVGRNIDEILRVLIALQMSEKEHVLIPADWQKGDDFLLHSPGTVKDAEALKAKNDPDIYSLAWYLWFKKRK